MSKPSSNARLWLAVGGIVVVVIALLLTGVIPGLGGRGQTAHLRWQAPTEGSHAVKYKVWIRDLDGAYNDSVTVDAVPGPAQSYAFTRVEPAHRYEGRVAAIDSRGRQSPWSEWSPIYVKGTAAAAP